eukprot:SAG11_NODE_11415_length_762_cov_1.191554_1_plen_181_part_01
MVCLGLLATLTLTASYQFFEWERGGSRASTNACARTAMGLVGACVSTAVFVVYDPLSIVMHPCQPWERADGVDSQRRQLAERAKPPQLKTTVQHEYHGPIDLKDLALEHMEIVAAVIVVLWVAGIVIEVIARKRSCASCFCRAHDDTRSNGKQSRRPQCDGLRERLLLGAFETVAVACARR